MYFEAFGNLEMAVEIYEDTLKEKPGDDLITKRLVREVALMMDNGHEKPAVLLVWVYLEVSLARFLPISPTCPRTRYHPLVLT